MRTTREDLDGENTKTNVSVSSAMQPHCISMLAVYTEYASGTQNTCRNRSREDCTLSRVEGVAQTRSREVVLRPRSASRNNRMSSCCRRNVPVFFPFDEYYDSPARVLYPTWLVIRCPMWPLSVVEKVPNCASLVRLSVAAWDQWLVSMPVFRSFL